MLIRRRSDLVDHDVTPRHLFEGRRRLLAAAGSIAAVGPFASLVPPARAARAEPDSLTPLVDIAGYNNYQEFSSDKKAVRHLAQALDLNGWTVTVEGEAERPYTVGADELTKLFGREERICRLRCVEGWSMVVPWNGFPLRSLIERARPTSRARYVEFIGIKRSSEMIGQRLPGGIDWPYREGLRIDEAMHPLAFAVTGVYGEPLPKQNGAPLRIAIPWKYGFKSAKAIAAIRLVAEQPVTSWSSRAAAEYGFYGNVNPAVPHPRWSQARETRIGELRKRPTLYLNGYAEQVASLYAGMDPATLY